MSWVRTFHEWSKQFDPQPEPGAYNTFFYYGWRFVRAVFMIAIVIFGAACLWMIYKLAAYFLLGETP
jgi:hypothetical protein